MKKYFTLFLTAVMLITLSACQSDATTEDLDEVTVALEESLFVWNTMGFVNNMVIEEDGEVVQHLKMTMHVALNGQLYLEVEDLTDGSATLVSYVYIEGENEDAYLYDNDGFYGEGGEVYRIETYENIVSEIPKPSDVFNYLIYHLPKDDIEDEALKMNHYRVSFDGKDLDVNLSFTFTQGSEHETLVWKIEGNTDDFTFQTPETNEAEIRFFKSDFFDSFTGIDKSLHD